jgi:hypothetical protein
MSPAVAPGSFILRRTMMPVFTIETAYRLPVLRHRTFKAEAIDEACRLAVEDDNWENERRDYESAGETCVSGAWSGDAAHSCPARATPSRFDETIQRKADHFEVLLGLLKAFAQGRPLEAPERQFWGLRAQDAIANGEAVLGGVDDPGDPPARMTTYVVGRVINQYGEMDWDAKWGTTTSALKSAIRFPTFADAEGACARARALVPTFISGKTIEYRVVPIALRARSAR